MNRPPGPSGFYCCRGKGVGAHAAAGVRPAIANQSVMGTAQLEDFPAPQNSAGRIKFYYRVANLEPMLLAINSAFPIIQLVSRGCGPGYEAQWF